MNLLRSIAFTREDATRADSGDDLIVDMAFASEEPYERWWGVEILDCSDSAVRMDRLNNGAALLYNHNWNDLRGTHVPGSIKCVDGVLRGKARITSATALGRDTIALVETDVLTKASVGYNVHKVIEQTTVKGEVKTRELDGSAFEQILTRAQQEYRGDVTKFRRELDRKFGAFTRSPDEPPVYRVVDWEPFENSLVTIPADDTVGIGRMAESAAASTVATPPKGTSTERSKTMTVQVEDNAPAGAAADAGALSADNQRKLEQARCAHLSNLAEKNAIPAGTVREWIESGKTVDQAAEDVLKILEKRAKDGEVQGRLGLSNKEIKQYSLLRMAHAVAENKFDKAGLEVEINTELAKKLGRDPSSARSFFVPSEVQHRNLVRNDDVEQEIARRVMQITGRRDLTVASGSGGGFLVGTQNVSFVELQRASTVLYAMGARRLGGLRDNITIPRQTSGATAYWLATEATTITESQLVLGQIALTPKNVGAYTEVSKQLAGQSNPDVESIVMADLAAQVGVDIDAKGINGSGASGQPTGLLNVSGVGSVTGTSIAYAGIIEFQTDVFGSNNPLTNAGYVTTGAVAGLLKARVKFSSTASPIWNGRLERTEDVDGYRGLASNNVPSATIIFGDFSQVIIAEWGVLEVDVNPYAGFTAGIIGIRAMASIDVALRYPSAFSVATSVT